MTATTTLTLPRGRGKNRMGQLYEFAKKIVEIQNQIGFRISARGWCYQLEGFRLINKDQFDRVESVINYCRHYGLLPIDFTAEEEGRKFSGLEETDCESVFHNPKYETHTPLEYLKSYLEASLKAEYGYTPDWWKGEEFYVQMIVEKIDLKTLFTPVCKEYHIPIATSKGWSSMLQRAEYAKRYKLAESAGLKCVLLYCGDHDPDGLRISEFLRSNLNDLAHIRWNDGTRGYDPSALEIKRFGLNFDFIEEHGLTWIDNLITGSGNNLASERHPNHNMEYVQNYLAEIGERKCEANALVINPEAAQLLCRTAIQEYLGEDAQERFRIRRQRVINRIAKFRRDSGIEETLNEAIDQIDNDESEEEEE